MGLSSKQVSTDLHNWKQTMFQSQSSDTPPKPQPLKRQPPQNPPLRCPRCDSSNTKFCYYNNYNKTQPRHFCKSCKRHWTSGGTLRNVPVGGAVKNKRRKTSTTTTTNATSAAKDLPFILNDQKNLSEILYQALTRHPPPPPEHGDSGAVAGNFFLGSNEMVNFPFSNIHNNVGEFKSMEDPAAVTNWLQLPTTSGGAAVGIGSCWNWDDADLNLHWEDSNFNPN